MSFLTAYQRYRLLWGALDWQFGSESPYTNAQTGTNLGTSAAAGVGVGVRRCVLHLDRTGQQAGADDAEFHFDFLNLTGGTPDDTWTSSDYTTLEGYLDTFWTAVKGYVHPAVKLAGYHWYRHGPGINPPNPAERVTSRSVVGTSGSDALPPQVAATITFRTAVRRSWGRTYLAGLTDGVMVSGGGTLSHAVADNVCAAAATLLTSAVGHDFPLVVTSKHLNAVLNVESLEVDDLSDVQRRRRWRAPTYRKILP